MKIDYKQIEQDFPKAFAVFKNSPYYKVNDTHGYLCFDDRDLYDFFDEQVLIIEVYIAGSGWYWTVSDGDEEYDSWSHRHKNRTEAECAAFNAAFKLLEETL